MVPRGCRTAVQEKLAAILCFSYAIMAVSISGTVKGSFDVEITFKIHIGKVIGFCW